jgi:hypothetical protein
VSSQDERFQTLDAWERAELDYQELRQEALLHAYMRSECFNKSREAFSRGMKDVAVFYSEKVQFYHFTALCI